MLQKNNWSVEDIDSSRNLCLCSKEIQTESLELARHKRGRKVFSPSQSEQVSKRRQGLEAESAEFIVRHFTSEKQNDGNLTLVDKSTASRSKARLSLFSTSLSSSDEGPVNILPKPATDSNSEIEENSEKQPKSSGSEILKDAGLRNPEVSVFKNRLKYFRN